MVDRKFNMDILRAVVALFVIYIHVDFDRSTVPSADLYLKSLLRWCVPLFFIMSGYFLRGPSIVEAISWSRIIRVAKITVAASLVYLPLFFLLHGRRNAAELLMGGTWFHLWFMSSLLFGLVFLKAYFRLVGSVAVLLALSIAAMLALHIVDYKVSCDDPGMTSLLVNLRFLQAIPLVWLGFAMRNDNLSLGLLPAAALALVGVLLCIAEAQHLSSVGAGSVNPQFPVGTLPMTLGLFWVFASIKDWSDGFMAKVGRQYSLHIYLLHPIVLMGIKYVGVFLSFSPDLILITALTLGPVISLFTPVLLDRTAPWFIGVLRGDWPNMDRVTKST